MGNNNSQSRSSYEQYYNDFKAREAAAPAALMAPKLSEVDPYEVLGVVKGCSWDQLKNAYRRTARLVHPDKGGSEKLFNLVTECFRVLATEINARENNRSHHELKSASTDYYASRPATAAPVSAEGPRDAPVALRDKFNKLFFEENRLEDDHDGGYGDVMVASDGGKREEIAINRIALGKYNKKKFNDIFEKTVTNEGKDVIVYKEPEPMVLAKKLTFTEIGAGRPDDYSADTTQRGLQYTDYMKAHTTTRLVDPRAVKERETFKTVEAYQNARDTAVKVGQTPEEAAFQAQRRRAEEKAEEERGRRAASRDQVIADHYARMSQATIGWNRTRV